MTRYTSILIIVLSLVAWSQDQPKTSAPAKGEARKSSTGSVSGQVLYEDTGKPVRHARVMLIPEEEGGNPAVAISDREGNFRIPKVEEGNYIADVESPGCISAVSFFDAADFRRHDGPGPDTTKLKSDFVETRVDSGQETRLNAFCKRGSAIAGTITYDDGSPAPNIRVNLFRKTDSGIQQVVSGLNVSALTGNRTDDRGRFRIAGLSAGEYVLAASEDFAQNGVPDSVEGTFLGMEGSSLARIFYGDVPSLKEAKSIRLAQGEERDDADIHLITRKLHLISGTVISKSDQHPVAQANIALMMIDTETNVQGSALSVTDDDGKWSFDGIPDGAYTIMVQPGFQVRELEDKTRHPDSLKGYEATSREIKVQGQNLEGIKLEVKEIENKKSKPQATDDSDTPVPDSIR
jgi:5-hydroxyisourate hydrolase-like protein (transthyretin family)